MKQTTKVRATVGRENSRTTAPVVLLEDVTDWLSPQQARALGRRLITAADVAEQRFERWSKGKAPKKEVRRWSTTSVVR